MFFYAQLDDEDFCFGISQLSGEVEGENLISLEAYDETVLGRKYDRIQGIFTEERRPEEPVIHVQTLEEKVTEMQDCIDIILLRQEGVL